MCYELDRDRVEWVHLRIEIFASTRIICILNGPLALCTAPDTTNYETAF